MTTFARTNTVTTNTSDPTSGVYLSTALLLIAQFVLMYATLGILGSAINWPASLDYPAAQALPLIIAQRGAVALGYTSYFVSALLLAPIALLLYALLRDGGGRTLLLVATGFGVLASFAKLLGIVRWLVLMPTLAQAYVAPDASAATRDALAVTYTAFNAYAGGVGEALGVALFSGLWTLLLSIVLLRGTTVLPRWLGSFGVVAALLLLVAVAGVYGVELGPILIIQGIVWQFWLLALGVVVFRRRGSV